MRVSMDPKFESALSKCNSLKEIREIVTKTPGMEDALKDSVEPVKTLLNSLFFRWISFSSASQQEIEAFFSMLQELDPTITRNDRSKECLSKRPALKASMEHCCYLRKYVFGIKKCGKHDCQEMLCGHRQ